MVTRRTFLQRAPLLALAPTVPAFLQRAALGASSQSAQRILVVIQLDGGNDGINTVVPFADDGYAKHRQELRLPSDQLLKITDQLALHPSMRAAAELFEQQRLAIVQGVGYPNPNRSHEVSMATWHTARFDREQQKGYGWIGRALDKASPGGGSPDSLSIGDGAMPQALSGRRSVASSLTTLDNLNPQVELSAPGGAAPQSADDLGKFLRRKTLDAYATSDTLAGLGDGKPAEISYPSTSLSERLQMIARLIKADLGTRVFYAVQPGYDTHSTQLPIHARLMRELSVGLRAFLDDLASAGLEQRVLVMCFSEFGRRVKENASAGTDHGTAGPVFLAGSGVRGGIAGATPSLRDLENGDLKMTVDFRRVYATVLQKWLSVPPEAAVGGRFPLLPLLKT